MFDFLPPSFYTDGSFTVLGIFVIVAILSILALAALTIINSLSNNRDGIVEIGYQPYPQGNNSGNSTTITPEPAIEETETEEPNDDVFKESTLLGGLVTVRAWFRSSDSDEVIIKNNAPYSVVIRFSGLNYEMGDIVISPTDEITLPIDNLDCVDIYVARAEDVDQHDTARFLHDGEDLGIETRQTSTEEFTLLKGDLQVTAYWNSTWKDRLVLANLGDYDVQISFNNQDDAPDQITISPKDKVTLSIQDLDCLELDVADSDSDDWEDNLELSRP